jgi:hypothetical protein
MRVCFVFLSLKLPPLGLPRRHAVDLERQTDVLDRYQPGKEIELLASPPDIKPIEVLAAKLPT